VIHFDTVDDSSLKSIVVDRELLNTRIRQLQAVRHERVLPTGGWHPSILDHVVEHGLDVLSDVQLDWLFDNPVALFMLHENVVEEGGSYWWGD
jgi:hypothetical protein